MFKNLSPQTYLPKNFTSSRVISKNFKLHVFLSNDLLKNQSSIWQNNYSNRLQKHTFPSIQWQNGLDVLNKVESCRRGHENRRLKECHAIYDCTKDINTTDWFQAPNKWIHLYQCGFNLFTLYQDFAKKSYQKSDKLLLQSLNSYLSLIVTGILVK